MIKEHFDLIIAAIIVLPLTLYDMTFDLFLRLLHLLFEMLHIAFEWLELGIEHTVEHFFIHRVMAARSSPFIYCCCLAAECCSG